uniref:Uncharacterized protein n=1 Tax=Aegilops tauschii subsp. strangulata TaxID=200361 RepID=A0A453LD67_AEGTS
SPTSPPRLASRGIGDTGRCRRSRRSAPRGGPSSTRRATLCTAACGAVAASGSGCARCACLGSRAPGSGSAPSTRPRWRRARTTPLCSRSSAAPPASTSPTPHGACCPCSRPGRSQVPVAVAVVALQQKQVPVAVAVVALQQLQVPVAVAVVALQQQQIILPVACLAPEFYMSSGDLLELDEEQWFGGMDAGSYYASLAQGMLVAPPDERARPEHGEQSGVQTPLWSY